MPRTAHAVAAALAAATCSLIVVAAQKPTSPPAIPPAEILLTGRVTVPMVVMGNLPIVEVRINGGGPYRFGVETGAGFIIVQPDLVTKLGLARTGGPDDLPLYELGSVEIGAATFKGVKVHAMKTAQTEIDGVLGLPFYSELLLTLDYPGRQVTFERGSLPAADGQRILPMTKVGPFWGVPLSLGGHQFTAVVDTRSTGGFGVVPAVGEKLSFDGPLTVIGRARGAAIPETEVKAGRLAGAATLGAYTFPNPMVTVRPLPPGFSEEPMIGTQVLSQFTVTLDQKQARLRLAREGGTTITLGSPRPPTAPAPPGLADYVGRYGIREVRVEGDALVLQRDGGPVLRMVKKTDDEFGLADVPAAQIRFVRDASGAVVELRVLNPQGEWETARRVK